MSDSVRLQKTYGTICMILSFILFALATCCVWRLFLLGNDGVLLILPLMFLFMFFVGICIAFHDYFINAGKHMEHANQKNIRNRTISEDEPEEPKQEEAEEAIDISSLLDSARLQNTYGILYCIANFVTFGGVFLFDLYLFSKDVFLVFFMFFPECLIFLIIYAFASTACNCFMKAGMYLEKAKELENHNHFLDACQFH